MFRNKLILVLILLNRFVHSNHLTQEHRLLNNLIRNYEPSVRPVLNHNLSLNIYFRLKLTQVLDLSERDQVLTTNMWIEQEWYDDFLIWNIEDYGIRTIRIPSNRIWLPDTFIYNSARAENAHGAISGKYVMVRNDGLIKYPVPIKVMSNCEVDIAWFPFDQQICYLKFASWMYDLSAINFVIYDVDSFESNKQKLKDINTKVNQSKLRITPGNVDLSSYEDKSGWILMNVTLLRREKNHTQGDNQVPFSELIYFIHIKRHYTYWIINVIIPCTLLSILTCMTFWLPCLSGEKVTLGLTCFVAYSVFMLMVAEKVPATSETVPIISIYLSIVMSFTSVSIIMAVVVTNIYEKSRNCASKEQRIPKMMKQIFVIHLARIFRMQNSAHQLLKTIIKIDKKGLKKLRAEKDLIEISSSEDSDSNPFKNCNDKLFANIARDLIGIKSKKDDNYNSHILEAKKKMIINRPDESNSTYRSFSEFDSIDYRKCAHDLREANITESQPSSPVWLKRSLRELKKFSSLDDHRHNFSDYDMDTDSKETPVNKTVLQRINKRQPKIIERNDEDLSSLNANNKKMAYKKQANLKYRIKKENLSLYYAYEWIFAGLVLDRLFFWMYLISTILSYLLTLFVFPYLIQSNKNDTMITVP